MAKAKTSAKDCVGKMNSFAETVVSVADNAHRDSRGNRCQSFQVRDARGTVKWMAYHTRELGQFSIDPTSDAGQRLIEKERQRLDAWDRYELEVNRWEAEVIERLAQRSMAAVHAGRGILHVEVGTLDKTRCALKGMPGEVTPTMMSYDGKSVVMPVTVWHSGKKVI